MTIVTRTLYAMPSSLPALRAVCKAMAFVRVDIWARYGALQNVGKSAADEIIRAARALREVVAGVSRLVPTYIGPNPVPAPGSLALLAIGAIGAFGAVRRREAV
jgi:hypothetical protein